MYSEFFGGQTGAHTELTKVSVWLVSGEGGGEWDGRVFCLQMDDFYKVYMFK